MRMEVLNTSNNHHPIKCMSSSTTHEKTSPCKADKRSTLNNKPKILLVEDSLLIQKAQHYFLQSMQCDIDIASTGESAISLAGKNNYDLIFLDVGLPDTTGIDVCKYFREQLSLTTPIVVATAYGKLVEKDCLSAGANDFYTKPVTKNNLQEILLRFLPNHETSK